MIWSLCNELGCVADDPHGGVLAMQFKLALYAADASRPITGNTVQTPYLSGHFVDGLANAMDLLALTLTPTQILTRTRTDTQTGLQWRWTRSRSATRWVYVCLCAYR